MAELRAYQQTVYARLQFVVRLGLGACLMDDMGLGKTIQVISLVLDLKRESWNQASLLVVPAPLIENWKSELARFAPSFSFAVAHPSEVNTNNGEIGFANANRFDLIITTYGMVVRNAWMKQYRWRLVVFDEAQASKNSGAKQTRAVKELTARSRIALTGTPVENRLSDLWSLFDFLNPGLLGTAEQFGSFVKRLQADTTTTDLTRSRSTKIQIDIDALPKSEWRALRSESAGKMGTLVELLQGKLSKAMMELVRAATMVSFRSPTGSIQSPAGSRCGAVARTARICASTSQRCCTTWATASICRRNCCSYSEAWITWN